MFWMPTVFFVGMGGLYLGLYLFATNTIDYALCAGTSDEPSSCAFKRDADKSALEQYIKASMPYKVVELNPPAASADTVSEVFTFVPCFNERNNTALAVNYFASVDTTKRIPNMAVMPQNVPNMCRLAGCSWRECLRVKSSCDSTGSLDSLLEAKCVEPLQQSELDAVTFSVASVLCLLGLVMALYGCIAREKKETKNGQRDTYQTDAVAVQYQP
uniref:Uncharacterized protein n=1 Tax=Chromera velia CCMP2878 TaxID=1169474 RepID=A0A0G4HTS3_9ALVE|eukprot:Cvel_31552.t1-p1 / transcript=Cvel_31552.t1 / gene=Cvel_31552 / organism=Chromera_velia_CCMP2878 / gene_product=hypothetical protein / transcript_product=hypothetical protein / location=Cvel_scaffold4722:1712-4536(+) / protein_length=214 / sequence_SO=supercontig / SO=protein_coding / is_pseudo=false